ncbi:MAG: hypothetical protein WAK26_20310 [Terracidiphilus sp.]
MRFNIRAMAMAGGILWGGCVLLVGMLNLIIDGYGEHFLEMLASIYPGYHATRSFAEVGVAAFYAILDGMIAGGIFAWLYNRLARPGAYLPPKGM